jgi:hypothetical protein
MNRSEIEEDIINTAVAMLTLRQIQILHKMSKGKDLVMEGTKAFCGYESTSPKTVLALLRACAISPELGSEVGRYEQYAINETGYEILKRLENQSG